MNSYLKLTENFYSEETNVFESKLSFLLLNFGSYKKVDKLVKFQPSQILRTTTRI